MPRERAPGLPKLNWSPESDSMSVFCAASGSATSEQTIAAKSNLRIETLRIGTDWKDSRRLSGKWQWPVVSGQGAWIRGQNNFSAQLLTTDQCTDRY